MSEILTKAQLLDALRTTGDDATTRLRALPASAFSAGRYENGWNARQILAHIAAIEWTYARLVDLGPDGASPTRGAGPGGGAQDDTRRIAEPANSPAARRYRRPQRTPGREAR